MKLKKSKFVYIYKANQNEVCFFNAVNLNLLSGDETTLEKYTEFQNGTELDFNDDMMMILYNKGFLIPLDDNEVDRVFKTKKIRYQKAMELRKNRIGYLRISLTEHCNLACKYCFVNKIINEKQHMKQDLFKDIMEWFISSNIDKRPLIQYFGGEPLLKMDLIKLGNEMLRQAKQNGEINDYGQEIVTNGILLTDEIADYLAKNKFYVGFSVDGMEELNDINRVYKDGRGSFKDVIKGINVYKKYFKNLSLLVTPNNENIDHFDRIIPYLVEELGATEIAINTPQPDANGWEVSGDKLAKAIQETWIYCNEHNVRYNTPANNILFLINHKIPQAYSCMNLTYGQDENTWGSYINSTGLVSKCVVECDSRCTSDFYDFIKSDDIPTDFIEWHFKNPMHESCLKCPGFNVCGGPCTIEQILSNGKVNCDKCKFVKTMIPWVIKK